MPRMVEIVRRFDVLYENRNITVPVSYRRLDLSNTFSLLTKIEVFTDRQEKEIERDIKRQLSCPTFFFRQTHVQSFCVKDSYRRRIRRIRQYKDLWNVCEDRCW